MRVLLQSLFVRVLRVLRLSRFGVNPSQQFVMECLFLIVRDTTDRLDGSIGLFAADAKENQLAKDLLGIGL